MSTLPDWLFWLLLILATFGLICLLIPLFFFLWILRQLWKEEKARKQTLRTLKKQYQDIDKAYR